MGPVLLAYARGLLSHEQGPHFVLFIYLFFSWLPCGVINVSYGG